MNVETIQREKLLRMKKLKSENDQNLIGHLNKRQDGKAKETCRNEVQSRLKQKWSQIRLHFLWLFHVTEVWGYQSWWMRMKLQLTWNQCTCICEHIWFESTHQRPSSGKLKYCKGGLDPISCTNFRKIAHQVYFKQHSMHQKLKGKTSKISSRVLSCLSLVHKFTIQIHLPVKFTRHI